MVMQNWGGGGINKVHYGICENGECKFIRTKESVYIRTLVSISRKKHDEKCPFAKNQPVSGNWWELGGNIKGPLCCGSILSLVQILFPFVSNSLSCYYHTLPYAKTKETKI